MKRILSVVGLGLVGLTLSAAPAFAQVYQGSVLVSVLDSPAQNARIPADAVLGGWTLNTKTGRHAASVQLWLSNEATRETVLVPCDVYWGPRADVQQYATLAGVPNPELALGFSLVPRQPLPFGAWRLVVYITDLQRDPDSINWVVRIDRNVLVQ